MRIPRKVFDCIVYLVESRGRAVGRDELIHAIWGHTQLTDNALGQTIRLARQILGDTGNEQHFIKTIRGFGYHWIAELESDVAPVRADGQPQTPEPSLESPAAPSRGSGRRPAWSRWPILAGAGLLLMAALYFVSRQEPPAPDIPTLVPAEGEIALLLPVSIGAAIEADDAWVRLGLMDLIAERLRAAGQVMVPSDTVIALVHELSAELDAGEVEFLGEITGARFVFAANVTVSGARWTVTLRSRRGVEPSLAAVGEAHDVLEAARIAADELVLALGLVPAPGPDGDPEREMLLRRIEAARLAQRMDVARALIGQADEALRHHPEVRFQQARIEFYEGRLDAAQTEFEALLEALSVERDPALYARTINGLAAIYALHGERDPAQSLLQQAEALMNELEMSEALGTVYTNLGNLAQEHGDFDTARRNMAQARRVREGVGDVGGLAHLDLNVGVLETRRSRYREARTRFERAAGRFAAVHDLDGELRASAYIVLANLVLLDMPAAAAAEPRVSELLARAPNSRSVSTANLSRGSLLAASGQLQAGVALFEEMVIVGQERTDFRSPWIIALAAMAEGALAEGDLAAAHELAADVVERLAMDDAGFRDNIRAQAWLTLVRVYLARGDVSRAAVTAAAMAAWGRYTDNISVRVHVALASAEVARAEGRQADAATGYGNALALANDSQVPQYLFRVAESYVPWLLEERPGDGRRAEDALSIVEILIDYADNHYGVALLQLRVYHALGPTSAWRAALGRVRSLAGERRIPVELTEPP